MKFNGKEYIIKKASDMESEIISALLTEDEQNYATTASAGAAVAGLGAGAAMTLSSVLHNTGTGGVDDVISFANANKELLKDTRIRVKSLSIKNLKDLVPGDFSKAKKGFLDKIYDSASYYFAPGADYVNHADDADLILHELGHAKAYAKSGTVRKAVHTVSRMLPMVGIAMAAKLSDEGNEYKKYVPLVAASTSMPMIVEEAIASGYALKHLHKTKGIKRTLQAAAKLAPALATYASIPVGLYLGSKYYIDNKSKVDKYLDSF